MSEQKIERWRELCEQASAEQDPKKLHQLIKEIIRALDARDQQSQRPSSSINPRSQAAGQVGSSPQQ